MILRAVNTGAGCRLPRLRRIRRANTGAVKTGAFGNLGYAAPATPRRRGNPESGNLGYAAPSIPAPDTPRQHRRRDTPRRRGNPESGNLGYAAP